MKATNYTEIPRDELSKYISAGDEFFLKDQENNLYKIEVDYSPNPDNPRNWENLCTIISGRGNWNIADEGFTMTREEADEILNQPDVYSKPVYMYDHSMQTISLTPFGDPWDSGICGVIFTTKEKVKEWGFDVSNEDAWHKIADEHMESEIKIYDQYIKGSVYYFRGYKAVQVDCESETGKTWSTIEWEEDDTLDCAGDCYGDDLKDCGILDFIPNEFTFVELKED